MNHEIYNIGILAGIDEKIDELLEEFGDLPLQSKKKKDEWEKSEATAKETEVIITEIKEFCSSARTTLVELKDREDKLKQQQFDVQNNKEFDAITNEIAFIRREHSKLSENFRDEGLKLENLEAILEKQNIEYQAFRLEYDEKVKEIENISVDQSEEIELLNQKRKKIIEKIEVPNYKEYERIRKTHKDAAMAIMRSSCSGCFSSIPAQVAVNVRNNLTSVYYCENCGRIFLPEEYVFDEDILDEL